MTILDRPLRSIAVATRAVELRRHLEEKRPAWVLIPGDMQVRLVYVGHDDATVDLGAGERRTLPVLEIEVLT